MLEVYAARTSLFPGESLSLRASSDVRPCRLEIARVGASREVVYVADIEVGEHPAPSNADTAGCNWPEAASIPVDAAWPSGYYDVRLEAEGEHEAHAFMVVKSAPAAPRARLVLVLSTNTWHAYNSWGGASAYAHVESFMARRASLAEAMENAIGVLSTQRPFPPLLLAPPPDMPRLVNLRPRGFEERPWAGADPAWSRAHRQSPYDGSAGFLNKWEHIFAAWLEAEGQAVDYLTDYDLDADPHALDGYEAMLLAGHSEYWSGPQRRAVDAFVARGGRLACFSGNTAFWKVRWEAGGERLICHKWRGFDDDPVAATDPSQATHLWSHPAFGAPEAQTTGLSFIFGGYHRLGLCAARGAGGYTVHRADHWALEGCDLYYGDVFGADVPLLGYENDGCVLTLGEDGLPAAAPVLGTPPNLEVIASAPAAFAEAPSPYRPVIPPEQLDIVAQIAFGSSDPKAQARVLRGHAVMASFRKGEGEVFNGGTTEWAHALAADDPFVTRITRNVLKRFLT